MLKMIKLTSENTQRAIERCRQLKPKVKFIQERLFVVYSANNSNVYQVRFDVQNGEKFGVCECKAIGYDTVTAASPPSRRADQ
jgi:hypothetical protein